jgi:hypothetical protein
MASLQNFIFSSTFRCRHKYICYTLSNTACRILIGIITPSQVGLLSDISINMYALDKSNPAIPDYLYSTTEKVKKKVNFTLETP